jgi:hypothetical protein
MSFEVESTGDVLRSLVEQSLREGFYLYSAGGSTPVVDEAGRGHLLRPTLVRPR